MSVLLAKSVAEARDVGAEAEQTALNVTVCPAEVRCRGFIVVSFLGELGVCGQSVHKMVKEMSDEANYYIWMRRNSPSRDKKSYIVLLKTVYPSVGIDFIALLEDWQHLLIIENKV